MSSDFKIFTKYEIVLVFHVIIEFIIQIYMRGALILLPLYPEMFPPQKK